MIKRVLILLYHFIWYTFAIIIINAAVFVTVVRLALPEIGSYKDEIQSWVSEYMDHPVVFDEITAEWQGWIPHLYLKDIDLYTKDNSQMISRFDSASLGIDLIASLSEGEIVPSQLSVTGLNLELTRKTDGSLSISSGQDSNLNTINNDSTALSEWLLKQKHIILENSYLTLNDEKTTRPAKQFENVRIELRTNEERIQLNASVILPDQYGQALSMKMDVYGNILTPDWAGEIYVQAENINPGDLLEELPVNSVGGNANIKVWTRWEQAKLIDFTGAIDYKRFSLKSTLYELPVNSVIVSFYGERQNNKDWILHLKLEDLETFYGLWPSATYSLVISETDAHDFKYSGHLAYLKIDEVLPFIVSANILPEETFTKFDWRTIKGEFTNLDFIYDPNTQTKNAFRLHSQFKNFSISSVDNNSISGADGSLIVNAERLNIKLDSQNAKLDFGSIFDQTIYASSLQADIDFTFNQVPELLIKKMDIANDALTFALSGDIKFNEQSPFLDLVAHVDETNIENIPDYLPQLTKPKLHDWLKKALVGGKLLSADMIYRGHVDDFPFNNSEGNFKAILNIGNATLEYLENWPPIDNLTAEVIIDNNNIYIDSSSGYIFDAKINNINANIKDIGERDLHVLVHGKLTGHTTDARHFIIQSPLKDNPSLFEFSQTNIAGGLELDLNLDIPLNNEKTVANGTLGFTDTIFESSLPGLGLEDVNGKIEFTRDSVWATGINALYHGKPVEIAIPREEEHEPGSSSFVISGNADKNFIIEQLTSFFPSLYTPANSLNRYFDGESQWAVTIERQRKDENTINRFIELSSDLDGIAVNLPAPLGKLKDEIRPLNIKTQLLDSSIEKIDINYDNTIYTNILVDNSQDFMIKKILVGLGSEHPAANNTQDISIQGRLEQLDISEWINFLNSKDDSHLQAVNTNTPARTILYDIFVNNLNMFNHEFSNTQLILTKPAKDWNIFVEGNEIKGQAILSDSSDKNKKLLNAKLEYLVLNNGEGDTEKPVYSIANWPELDIKIDNFTYENNILGKTILLTNNDENGIHFNELNFSKPGFTIKAKGNWSQVEGIDRSEFTATLDSESINTMLETFGYDATNIEEGQTNIRLSANWMDSPMNFSINKIIGELDMEINKGQFLDINPKAGRLFGLLSLQTLPRRLTLDFADVFNEGFTFDTITGNFSLQQGHAYTNDLELKSTSADIIVSGRTGLVTEDYDQIATVTPKISDSLPVASALFGPVGAGVGAVIFLAGELFESIPKQIDKILSTQYSIKGSWDHPDIEKLSKEKKLKQSG